MQYIKTLLNYHMYVYLYMYLYVYLYMYMYVCVYQVTPEKEFSEFKILFRNMKDLSDHDILSSVS